MRRALVLSSALLVAGCGDPLKDPARVEETRVVGAKAEVVGDPGRASPAPGEGVTVSWLVASPGPEPAPALGWAFAVCAAQPSTDGRARCDGAPFAVAARDTPAPGSPAFEVAVPAELVATRIAVVGVVCTSSPLGLDDCVSGRALRAQLEILVEREGVTNRNPSFPAAGLAAGGADWAGCPEVKAGRDVRLELSPSPTDRESLPGGSRETLQVAHLGDRGELERALSIVEPDVKDPTTIGVSWTAPDQAGPARFWWVLRDLRGGVDFGEKQLCVIE